MGTIASCMVVVLMVVVVVVVSGLAQRFGDRLNKYEEKSSDTLSVLLRCGQFKSGQGRSVSARSPCCPRPGGACMRLPGCDIPHEAWSSEERSPNGGINPSIGGSPNWCPSPPPWSTDCAEEYGVDAASDGGMWVAAGCPRL
jgi:hypothetical protein